MLTPDAVFHLAGMEVCIYRLTGVSVRFLFQSYWYKNIRINNNEGVRIQLDPNFECIQVYNQNVPSLVWNAEKWITFDKMNFFEEKNSGPIYRSHIVLFDHLAKPEHTEKKVSSTG